MFRAAILAFGLVATPAFAEPMFQAQPEVSSPGAKFALRDTLWRCGEAGCVAARSSSRPGVVCAVLAKEVGALRSFSFEGKALAAEELDKCNSRAKKLRPAQVRTAARP